MNVSLTQNEWLVWPQNQAYSNQENRHKNNELFDKHNNIPSLWKDLGVTESYKVTFVNIVSELDSSPKSHLTYHQ